MRRECSKVGAACSGSTGGASSGPGTSIAVAGPVRGLQGLSPRCPSQGLEPARAAPAAAGVSGPGAVSGCSRSTRPGMQLGGELPRPEYPRYCAY